MEFPPTGLVGQPPASAPNVVPPLYTSQQTPSAPSSAPGSTRGQNLPVGPAYMPPEYYAAASQYITYPPQAIMPPYNQQNYATQYSSPYPPFYPYSFPPGYPPQVYGYPPIIYDPLQSAAAYGQTIEGSAQDLSTGVGQDTVSQSADKDAEGGEDETIYYWDEETEMYFYWDDSLQAYVGWVEEAATEEQQQPQDEYSAQKSNLSVAASPGTSAELQPQRSFRQSPRHSPRAGQEVAQLMPSSPRVIMSPRGQVAALNTKVRAEIVQPPEPQSLWNNSPEGDALGEAAMEVLAQSQNATQEEAADEDRPLTGNALEKWIRDNGRPAAISNRPRKGHAEMEKMAADLMAEEEDEGGGDREKKPDTAELNEEQINAALGNATSKMREDMLEREMAEEAKRAVKGQRATVRRLTRKLTLMGKQQSMGEQLKLLAQAREEAGVHVPTDQEILQRQRTREVKKKARQAAGDSGSDSSELDSDLRVMPDSDAISQTQSETPSRHSAPVVAQREAQRRGTARFGTAHFKDPKLGEGLAQLLNKKVH